MTDQWTANDAPALACVNKKGPDRSLSLELTNWSLTIIQIR